MQRRRRIIQDLILMGGSKPWYLESGVTPIAAYLAKSAASYAASKINLVNPGTYDISDGAAFPTWGAAGWAFDGATQYLNTGINVAVGMSFAIQCNVTDDNAARVIFGARVASGNGVTLMTRSADGADNAGIRYSAVAIKAPRLSGIVNYIIAGTKAYRNGVDEGLNMVAVLAAQPIFIGALNNNGAAALFYLGSIQAYVAWNVILTPTQVAVMAGVMAAL
jgi:hypothetical protein